MKKLFTLPLMAGLSLVLSSQAFAQQQNEISPNTIEGVTLTSNSDNVAAEFILLRDSGFNVFYADGDVLTLIENQDDIIIKGLK